MVKKPTKRGSKPPKTCQPTNLAERLADGATFSDLAKEFKVHRKTVAGWAQKPEIQDEIESIKADQRKARADASRRNAEKLQDLQSLALQNLGELLRIDEPCSVCGRGKQKDGKVTIKGVEIVFDRTGLHKTEKRIVDATIEEAPDEVKARKDILQMAALILLEEGRLELSAQIQAAL